MFSLISNIHTLQDVKLMMHHKLQDSITMIVPEGATQHIVAPHMISPDLMRKLSKDNGD